MTERHVKNHISAVALSAALLMSGCGTATIEDAVPVAATAPAVTGGQDHQAASPPTAVVASTETGAAETTPQSPAASFATPGNYPNLNIIPQPATTQMTAEEKDADTTLLRSIRDQQRAEGASVGAGSRAEELRRLARTHASDALKRIEGE